MAPRILVVEDAAVNRVVAEALLTELGACVRLARDGAEALVLLRETSYDLILMDCHLPLVHGFEVVRTLRAEPGPNQRTPVIALTAGAAPELELACRRAGMDDYLEKPIRCSELVRKLERWLCTRGHVDLGVDEGERADEAPPQLQARAPDGAPRASANATDRLELEAFLREFEREAGSSAASQLAATYRDSVPEAAHTLARTAGLREQELDRSALAQQAHALRGAARSMGLWTLATILAELERACGAGEQTLLQRLSAEVEARLLWLRDALPEPRAGRSARERKNEAVG